MEVDEEQPVEIRFVASDPDVADAEVRYRLIEGPPGSTIDAVSGDFRWVPTEEDGPGVFAVTVEALGWDDQTALISTVITVREVNSPPSLALASDRAVEAGSRLEMSFVATDADLPVNDLRFGFIGLIPAGATIDPVTGLLTWDVEESNLEGGIHKLTISVTDEGGLTASTDVTIRVLAGGTIAKRGLLIDAVQVSASGFANPSVEPDAGGMVRTLVVLGEAGSYTIELLRVPLLMVAALILAFGTVGKITVGSAGSRRVETGVVDWFDSERGFGYIRSDSGDPPVFIHENALRRGQRTWFASGVNVKYRAISGSNRAFVRWVRNNR